MSIRAAAAVSTTRLVAGSRGPGLHLRSFCDIASRKSRQIIRTDGEWRRHWLEDNPGYIMPPQEDPPFNRDYLMPVSDDVQPPDALEWLRASWSSSALATNRFGTTAEAITFVEQLHAAGATRVTIDNIMMLPNHGWTPYADTLIVDLPEVPARRRELFELMEHVGRPDEDGGMSIAELFIDCGQRSIRLWWD